MADWFVARSGQQQGPFTQEGLRERAGRGEVAPNDLVWREGMPQWIKAEAVAELAGLFSAAAGPAASQPIAYAQPFSHGGSPVLTDRAIEMLRQTSPWARLFGVLIFIAAGMGLLGGGVMLIAALAGLASGSSSGGSGGTAIGAFFLVVGFVYVGIAILYFFPGMYLNRYASRINLLVSTRREDALEQALEAQKSFWKFLGMIFLISIGIWLLMVVLMFGIGAFGANALTNTTFPTVPTTPVTP